jgi:virginiamycin B lyase
MKSHSKGRCGRSLASIGPATCLVFAIFGPGSGAAQAQVVTEFSAGITTGAGPYFITAGPDGNLWFTEFGGGARIGRITPAGVVTEFSAGITLPASVLGIANGPDGNLWFTEQFSDRIGRIAALGAITEVANVPAGSAPTAITTGPDGNLWFTEQSRNRIGRITPGGVVTEFGPLTSPIAAPFGITAGPDGNVWFTENNGNLIGRITPAGVVTEFSAGITNGAGPLDITTGPDGNLWFTESTINRIGRITPLGVVTEFFSGIFPGAGVAGIAAGPDGNLWFTERFAGRIGRITTAGVITEFFGITVGADPVRITAGPDGNMWFTEHIGGRIGRITTGVGAGGAGFLALSPCRVLDTRNPTGSLGGPSLQPAGSPDRTFVVAGACGVPTDAAAVSVNVAVTNAAGSGYLSLYRGGGARTSTYSISFSAGQTRANNAILQLALDGSGSFNVQNASLGTVDFILDVNGYFR